MKKIVANFKMNQTPTDTKKYLMTFLSRVSEDADVTLCLPFTSIAEGVYLTRGGNVKIGAQNLSDEEKGSFTGEISGAMLKDAGVSEVIVGHNERRAKFKENSKIINKKIKIALKNRLKVILCVGESLAQRNTLKTFEVLKEQLEEALKGLYQNELDRIVIAYEPIWATGTGKHATQKEVEEAVKIIRKVISEDFSAAAAENICVLYGGSITQKNCKAVMNAKGINGALIGAASCDPLELVKIINII